MRYYNVPSPSWNQLDGNRRDALLSVIVPCKNEEAVLRETHRRLVGVLQQLIAGFEIVYVDDGSTDSTFDLLREIQGTDSRVRIVQLSRNFGHQVAITAGLEHASGKAAVLIDADLQDPPEVIPMMVEQWRNGFDVVYGLRTERDGETLFKLWTAKAFYRLINHLSGIPIALDTGDFRLMDRKVVNALLDMPEHDRFLRGMISWLGFRQIAVPYRRAARQFGETKYPLLKMLRFAMDGIASFSALPLKMATWLGFSASGVAIGLILYAICVHVFTNRWVTGWTSLFIAVLFVGGAQLVCLGIIGEYVGRIYGETKRRPLYLVQELVGFGCESEDSTGNSPARVEHVLTKSNQLSGSLRGTQYGNR
ncbi:MAG: glycosyltransferase family 2 protein [Acidobacteriia bacterium]|nr:glycosyltransferase family 2 protein [Terriglobia bacterium]